MRMTLATLELASGSEAPRPTTISRVSSAARRRRPPPALRWTRSPAAAAAWDRCQLAAVVDRHPGMLGLIGVEHRGDVVLGVAGGEEHAGHRQHAVCAALAQLVQAVADDRRGELEKAALDVVLRQALADARAPPLRTRGPRLGRGCRGRRPSRRSCPFASSPSRQTAPLDGQVTAPPLPPQGCRRVLQGLAKAPLTRLPGRSLCAPCCWLTPWACPSAATLR